MNISKFFCYSEQAEKDNNKKSATDLAIALSVVLFAILVVGVMFFAIILKPVERRQEVMAFALAPLLALVFAIPLHSVLRGRGCGVAYAMDSTGSLYVIKIIDMMSSLHYAANDFLHLRERIKSPDELYKILLNPQDAWGVAIWRVDNVYSFENRGQSAKCKIGYVDMKTGRNARRGITIIKNCNDIDDLLRLFENKKEG